MLDFRDIKTGIQIEITYKNPRTSELKKFDGKYGGLYCGKGNLQIMLVHAGKPGYFINLENVIDSRKL